MLQVQLFEHLGVSIDDQPLTPGLVTAVQSLLAFLLLRRHQPLSRHFVAFTLWPDVPEASALAHLRRHVHLLQHQLPTAAADRPWLLSDRRSVQWNVEAPAWVDVDEFERCCAVANGERQGDRPDAAQVTRAVMLYRGPLLVDHYDEWVLEERARLAHLYEGALAQLLGTQVASGDLHAAAETAERMVAHDALSEAAHRLRMGLRYLAGDRAASLRAYQECRHVLTSEVDVEPMPRTEDLARAIRGQDPPDRVVQLLQPDLPYEIDAAALTLKRVAHNLPCYFSRFVGRDDVRRSVIGSLCTHRLVTLVGPAGCGKTRMAIAAASDMVARIERHENACPQASRDQVCPAYPDGIWHVDLAAVGQADLVLRAVARVVGASIEPGTQPLDSLVARLRSLDALIILDNCEVFVAECAALVEHLLRECPHLRILATSREVLDVPGEAVREVPPLSSPPDDDLADAEPVLQCESGQLFVDRAQLLEPGFAVTDANAAIVGTVLRLLEGNPLAIELAAAQLTCTPIEQIQERLRAGRPPGPRRTRSGCPHHRSLRAAIDWSYQLLAEPEQRALRYLSVLHGVWTIAAAQALCCDAGDSSPPIDDTLSRLVDTSMVIVADHRLGPGAGFRIPLMVRAFAHEQLARNGELDDALRKLFAYCLARSEAADRQALAADTAE